MPSRVRYKNDSSQECTIRPTPLVAISTNILKNGAGEAFGVTYSITLTGTLLPAEGMPFATNQNGTKYEFFDDAGPSAFTGPYLSFDSSTTKRPARQKIAPNQEATSY